MTWSVTPDRFLSLWTTAGSDEFPFPLRYRSTSMWEDEHDADLHAAHEWRRKLADPRLEHAIRILHSGEVAVEVYSTVGNADVRVRGGVEGAFAVVARQHDSGDIQITPVRSDALPRTVVAQIPDAPCGREKARAASMRELTEPGGTTSVREQIGENEPRALRRLLLRDRSGAGSIRLLAPNAHGRFTTESDIGWFDVVDDGRYMFAPARDIRVVPATNEVVHQELLRRIDAVHRRGRDNLTFRR
ncbi:ESX secretion-associated protein EspG [Rhodococcus artemisiae]|uniref:ESX secretion-associated protein EspG n=1 Tax=Rhodococcus artemisiae TaxID=714159 RepID=A0ABU7LAB2_9NOCA|nr:ESX secretion-associated protein EspG [Rhodococcus artemisiae]MEE2058496.1 ESX secretion-associated protein EspG [Rhodococcus artemisiae]